MRTPSPLATYTYDYLGRRVKKVTTTDALQGATQIAYLYDGWNIVAEYDLTASNPSASPIKRHDWGLDLSGSIQGAGGVGGLIRTKISSTSYYPTYDGNGNICELIHAGDGTFGARHQYDPFGLVHEKGDLIARAVTVISKELHLIRRITERWTASARWALLLTRSCVAGWVENGSPALIAAGPTWWSRVKGWLGKR